MRLIHFAFAVTVVLLGITGYLAWEGQQEAKGARAEVDFMRKQQASMGVDEKGRQLAIEAATLPMSEAEKGEAPPLPVVSAESDVVVQAPAMAGTNVLGVSTEPDDAPPSLPGGRKTPGSVSEIPLLTSQQKKVLESDIVARIKEVKLEQGFVVVDAGINKNLKPGETYDVRRESSLVGRVKVSDIIEASEAVADVLPGATPPGVKIESGDELVVPLNK